MRTLLILSSLLATLAVASPLASKPRDQFHGISIGCVTSYGLDPNKVLEPAPVELYTLTPICGQGGYGLGISELIVQNETASGGLNIEQIQRHGYKDFEASIPGTTEFDVNHPAL
ncbi:uncharacterized protein PAC_13434 [Phialocephala subalpina]|uniref:Uncharacterized protein n=1 Tax=Phialocephala subalpina TaxID=576137 RepID=A0A1L7XF07_9HELO|nr:uncharacterized protein PAC_13434 [Phialocephala subalpina]